MRALPLRFAIVLLATMAVTFVLHLCSLSALGYSLWADMIVLSYIINFLLALGIFLALYFFRNKLSNSLGFLFMAGSLLKFVVFFLVFYPTYKSDGELQRSEFAAFFVPYLVALILETFFASKMLQKLDK